MRVEYDDQPDGVVDKANEDLKFRGLQFVAVPTEETGTGYVDFELQDVSTGTCVVPPSLEESEEE